MTAYSKLVRSSAIYDLILTSAFAFPVIAAWKLSWLQSIHQHLSLSGTFPTFDTMHLMFVNFLGSVVLIWSVLRLLRPEPVFGFYDGLCRMLFSTAMAYTLFAGAGSAMIWLFLIPEVVWGCVQLLRYPHYSTILRNGRVDSAGTSF